MVKGMQKYFILFIKLNVGCKSELNLMHFIYQSFSLIPHLRNIAEKFVEISGSRSWFIFLIMVLQLDSSDLSMQSSMPLHTPAGLIHWPFRCPLQLIFNIIVNHIISYANHN